MAWEDYKELDVTKEQATPKEVKERISIIDKEKNPDRPTLKGGRADRFKKRYSS